MKSKEDIRPISYIRANAPQVLAQISETQRPLYITQNGEAKAVLLSTESYEKMTRAIGLLKLLAQGEQDLEQNRLTSQEEVFAEMDSYFEGLSKNGR